MESIKGEMVHLDSTFYVVSLDSRDRIGFNRTTCVVKDLVEPALELIDSSSGASVYYRSSSDKSEWWYVDRCDAVDLKSLLSRIVKACKSGKYGGSAFRAVREAWLVSTIETTFKPV